MERTILKPQRRVLFAVLIIGYVLAIQLVGIQRPFLGHYGSYQGTVMGSIARNMVRENFSEILLPKTDAVLEGKRSLHLNQYPLPSLLAADAVKFLGGSYEFWGRFQAVIFNLFSILVLFFIARRLFDERAAWLAAAIFALSPLTIVYGQSFMSEASSLFFFLCSFYFLVCDDRDSVSRILLSAVLFSIAVTGRLHWILFLPFFCVPIWWTGSQGRFRKLFIFGVVSLILPLAWYAYTYFASLQAPHIHTNLFLQMATSVKESFWLRGDLYRAVGLIFGKSMLAGIMIPFFLFGIGPALKGREGRLCLAMVVGVTVAVMVLSPIKLIHHDFYLYAVFPFVAILTGLGFEKTLNRFPKFASVVLIGLLAVFLVASAVFSLRTILKVPSNEKEMVAVAVQVRSKTAPDEQVIVGSESIGPFVFYLDRPWWALVPNEIGAELNPYLRMTKFTGRSETSLKELEEVRQDPIAWLEYLRSKGAAYFVAPQPQDFHNYPEFLRYLDERYENISENPQQYLFYRLRTTAPNRSLSVDSAAADEASYT